MSLITKLNGHQTPKEAIQLSELTVGNIYPIVRFRHIGKTTYGAAVLATIIKEGKEIDVFLPKGFADSMSPHVVEEYNRQPNIDLHYLGPGGRAYNLRFEPHEL